MRRRMSREWRRPGAERNNESTAVKSFWQLNNVNTTKCGEVEFHTATLGDALGNAHFPRELSTPPGNPDEGSLITLDPKAFQTPKSRTSNLTCAVKAEMEPKSVSMFKRGSVRFASSFRVE